MNKNKDEYFTESVEPRLGAISGGISQEVSDSKLSQFDRAFEQQHPDYASKTALHNMKESIFSYLEEVGRQDRQRLYTLENKLSRFERVFEQLFQEELEKRVGAKNSYGADCAQTCIDPLYTLKSKLGL